MLPTNFGVNWPFDSGEAKNRFSRLQPWRPSWISDQNDFSYFDLLVTLMRPIKFQDNWPLVSVEEAIVFQDASHGFPIETILAIFLSTSHPDVSYQVSCQLYILFRRGS